MVTDNQLKYESTRLVDLFKSLNSIMKKIFLAVGKYWKVLQSEGRSYIFIFREFKTINSITQE